MRAAPAVVLCAALSLLMMAGCQAINPNQPLSWLGSNPLKMWDTKNKAPVKIVTIWAPAIFNDPGKPPTRGLGGRIYFYNSDNQPVQVEGQLVVFAYDDTKPTNDQRVPDRKYAFPAEHFQDHYSPTELGPSYSVWIPWDEVGKPQAEISLLPVFTAATGQLVTGQASRNLLPGPKAQTATSPPANHSQFPVAKGPEPAGPETSSPSPVQPASFEQPALPDANSPKSDSLESLSIPLPTAMAEHLARVPPGETLSQKLARERLNNLQARARALLPPVASTTDSPPPAAAALPTPTAAPPSRSEHPRPAAPTSRAIPPTAGQILKPPFHAE